MNVRALSPLLTSLSLLTLATACSSFGDENAELKTLQITVAQGASPVVAAGLDLDLVARATYTGGLVEELTSTATWSSLTPEIATVSDEAGKKGLLHALATGTAKVKVTYGTAEATLDVDVGAALVTGLVLDQPELSVERHATAGLRATASYTDGSTRDVTEAARWAVSDTTTATVTGAGQLEGLRVGNAVATAELDGQTASANVVVTCTYPEGPADIQQFEILPRVTWAAAYRPDGTTARLDLKEVYCGLGEFAEHPVTTIGVYVGAGWCPNCPAYERASQALAADAEANGMMMIFAEVQDEAYRASNSAYAHREVSALSPDGRGWRVGDTDADPRMYFVRSPYISAFPSAFVVRVRDMRMIADRDFFPSVIPFDQIAARPEEDWSKGFPFVSACHDGDEEAGEPNDTWDSATPLPAGQVVHGGICTAAADFYNVSLTGRWRATLDFVHRTGDLDLYVWDPETNQPKMNGQTPVGSAGTTNREQFTYSGNAILAVVGYANASGAYDLMLEAL